MRVQSINESNASCVEYSWILINAQRSNGSTGYVFLGTPQRGIRTAKDDDPSDIWKELIQGLAGSGVTPEVECIMQAGSPFLDNQRAEFSLIGSHIVLICAYERQRAGMVSCD